MGIFNLFDLHPLYFDEFLEVIDPVLFAYYESIHKDQTIEEIFLIKAKGGEDKSAPSFKRYIAERHPEYAIRFSKQGYRKDGEITNRPLYLARKTRELI